MNHHRRGFLHRATATLGVGIGAALGLPGAAEASDYRALVVLHLNGGNDGNNVLVPLDGGYADYERSRGGTLPLAKDSLRALSGMPGGRKLGLHPGLGPLVPLYEQGRVAWMANVGPLVQPTTAKQVLEGTARLPAFLLSHNDQTAVVQGWTYQDDTSGWAGRSIERLPSALRTPLGAVTMDTNRTLVLGRQSAVGFMPPGGLRWWGAADLAYPEQPAHQALQQMSRWQFANAYEAEYARSFSSGLDDSVRLTRAFLSARTPSVDFGTQHLGNSLAALASVLPVFKAQGLRRQVFLVHWGGFDTHADQRGSGNMTQDSQLAELAQGLSLFDRAMQDAGMGLDVTTLVMTEFGRTLRTGSGSGSEHAWGNHWLAMGGMVNGGTVHGTYPSLVLGGADDGDPGRNGRFVPTMSSDQVGASLMQWMGLPDSEITNAFPLLANFQQKTIALMRS